MFKHRNKVLIIEDNLDISRATAKMLEILGYTSDQTHSRDEGWNVIQNTPNIDLVLMDISMDGMTVNDFMSKINSSHYDLPIIFTSGLTRREIGQFLQEKHYYFLGKPYDKNELETILNRI